MHGSLAWHHGSLYVGTHEKTARIRVVDLESGAASAGFAFRDERAGRSAAAGIGVDGDRRIWVADTPASRVRCFSLFGREVGGLGLERDALLPEAPWQDTYGVVRAPVDVAVHGDAEDGVLVVAGAGERRHAVQVFDLEGRFLRSLRSGGDPHARFSRVRGVALLGRYLYVAEAGRRCVQVFRDLDFHFRFTIESRGSARVPVAVAPLADGRAVVACDGPRSALVLVDASGRVLSNLAEEGAGPGGVLHPSDVAVEPAGTDAETRVVVIDRDGERIQGFTLEGRLTGAVALGA